MARTTSPPKYKQKNAPKPHGSSAHTEKILNLQKILAFDSHELVQVNPYIKLY